jgi:hypothetical protein
MGERIETPVSQLVVAGYNSVAEHIESKGPWLFFNWLALIFLKTHLKDRQYREDVDARKGTNKIAHSYDWAHLHHVHCVARTFFTQIDVHKSVLGSFLMLSAKARPSYGRFDFGDLYAAQTLILRLDDICFIAVLNDSGACLQLFKKYLNRIKWSLSPVQLREVHANLAYLNLGLQSRPTFATRLRNGTQLTMMAHRPKVIEFKKHHSPSYGQLLYRNCEPYINASADSKNLRLRKMVKRGKLSFIFDSKGQFIRNSME